MRLFRRLLPGSWAAHYQDEDILEALGVSSPTEWLRLSRLRYIGTLYKCTDLVPWGLLNLDSQWTELIADDLDWLWQQLRRSSTLPDPRTHLGAWIGIWRHHPGFWRRLVRRGGEHAILQRQRQHRVTQFHRAFLPHFKALHPEHFDFHSIPGVPPLHQHPPDASDIPACMACGQVFRSRGGLGAHMFKRHGAVSRLRLLFATTSCEICMKEFHTYSKMHAHLRYSASCREQLWGRRFRCSPESGAGSVDDQQLCHAHDGLLPPLRQEGPRLPAGPAVALPDYDLLLAEQIYEAILEREPEADIAELIRATITSSVITWPACVATMTYLLETMTDQDEQMLNLGDFNIKHFLASLRLPSAWPFLRAAATTSSSSCSLPELLDIEHACLTACAAASQRERIWPVPRPMMRERYIIHAFSGRRRIGDFQHFIVEKFQADFEDMTVFTISVDLMVDPIWGDVSKAHVRAFWLNAVRTRQVIGAFAGPPCETWSQARGKELPSDAPSTHAPRVIRDLEHLWGQLALALREVRQLDTGNLLLLFSIELIIELAFADGLPTHLWRAYGGSP